MLVGCAHKVRSYSAHDAIDALSAQSGLIKTERGRAWVSVRMPEQKISFPAVVVVDRTDQIHPKLRIEAMDPIGSTHALMILDGGGKLTWVDYDARRISEMKDSWHGLPLVRLPELLLGISSIPSQGRVRAFGGQPGESGIEVKIGKNLFRYHMEWREPGPKLALSGMVGEIFQGNEREKYVVGYSHFLDKSDFDLPEKCELRGFTGGEAAKSDAKASIEIDVDWRERQWNEAIAEQAFIIPPGVRSFSRY